MKIERRSLFPLALAFAVLMGCQREAVSPTPEPKPEPVTPVVPDPPKPDPILSVRTFGAYQIGGVDYTYQRGKHQMSRFYAEDSHSLKFSLTDPENTVVYSISGIDVLATKEDTQKLRFTITEDGKDPVASEFETTLVGTNGDTLWLKTAAKEYFVVKK